MPATRTRRSKKQQPERKRPEDQAAPPLLPQVIFDNLPDAAFAIDTRGIVVAWNRAMEKSTGVMADEILGRGDHEYALPFYGKRRPLLIDLLDEPDEKIREWGYTAIRRKGDALTAENPIMSPDNTIRILWGLAAPIFDGEGNRLGTVQSIADITRRWERETALENTVQKFREILDNIGAATIIIEEDDTISFVNDEFGRILGYVREETEGKKKWLEFVFPEDVRALQKDARRESLASDDPVRFEARLIRWDGEIRNAMLAITRIPGTQKLVVTILDITEKIRAESAVQQANRKVNVLNSIIRHDILNHLTVLKGNLDLARETNTDPAQRTVLDKEFAATNAIQSLITFTRDYQDIGSERPEWQDVRQAILNSRAGIRPLAIPLSVETGSVEIYADLLLPRVFSSLLSYAARPDRNTSHIRVFCEESFGELQIVCEDDGDSIPGAARATLFSRQFMGETGPGLFLAREILSITGIAIRETGMGGRGACFEIAVPRGMYRFAASQPDR